MKHFTLLELATDADSPMIGTIDNVTNDKIGIQFFKERIEKAIAEHFDTNEFELSNVPDMFVAIPYEDMKVIIDGIEYEIRILETWIY